MSAQLRPDRSGTPFDARLAPDGGTLWVVDTGFATVSGLAVSGAGLAELSSSPTSLPAGATASESS